MRFCAICNEGFEDLVAEEVTRRTGSDAVMGKSYVSFECDSEKAILFAYLTQSAKKVMKILSVFKAKDEAEIVKKAADIDYSSIHGSFCVRCSRHSIERDLGSSVYKRLADPVVDMESPDYLIYFHWSSTRTSGAYDVVAGVDLTGIDLSKRSYKIFAHPSSIKGTLAYFLVALSGFDGNGQFLDPCSGSGTICAEAAYLATGISPRFFDKDDIVGRSLDGRSLEPFLERYDETIDHEKLRSLKNSISSYDVDLQAVNSAKKNLKIGGIDKFVSVAKGDIDWLETKFEESSIDHIVSNPPAYSKYNQKKNDKFFDKFFYQTEFVLSDTGKIVILTNSERPISLSERYGLVPQIERRFMVGSSEMLILSFTKKH
ncbi:MAG: methyltransferase [Candidatus Woesearchaeota archaeon]